MLPRNRALTLTPPQESDNAAASFHLEMQSVENVPFGVLRWQLGLTGMAFGVAPDNSDTTNLVAKLDTWYPSLQLSDAFDLSALASVVDTSNIVADWTMPKFSCVCSRRWCSDGCSAHHLLCVPTPVTLS